MSKNKSRYSGTDNSYCIDHFLHTDTGFVKRLLSSACVQGTYYGEGRSGTCTYDVNNFPAVGLSSQIYALAALNEIKFFNSKACGMCFRVTSLSNTSILS